MEQRSPAAYVAEFLGTFLLVFVITMVVVLFVTPAGGGGSDWIVVGLVQGLVLFLLVQSLGSVSGAHVNPAVTIALTALRKMRPNDAVVYILLQLSGAVAGALMTKFILNDRIAEGPFSQAGATAASASAEVGTPGLNKILLGGTFPGAVMEGIGAFILVWAICAAAVNPRAAKDWAGLSIGLTLAFLVMIGGPLTGGSFNPARFFGPALVANHWTDAWLYLIAPVVGAVLGAFVYWYLFVESRIGGRAEPGAGPTGLRQDTQ